MNVSSYQAAPSTDTARNPCSVSANLAGMETFVTNPGAEKAAMNNMDSAPSQTSAGVIQDGQETTAQIVLNIQGVPMGFVKAHGSANAIQDGQECYVIGKGMKRPLITHFTLIQA